MNKSIKKAIITGATSMIGVALIEKLLKENIKVLAIVNPNSIRKGNIKNFKEIKIIEKDLKDILKINIVNEKYDIFYHLGWCNTAKEFRDDFEKQKINIKYSCNAVKFAHKMGCKLFIGAGSQAEYGRYTRPISEDDKINPETAYGKCKYLAYTETFKLCLKYNIIHIWPRIFSVYGPYDSKNTLISYCIINFLNRRLKINLSVFE